MLTDQATLQNLPTPAELPHAVRQLKTQLNAVILAHFYQESEIQDIADFISRVAR